MSQSFHKVNIIESERGWGSRIDEVRYFSSLELAQNFINEYNKYNEDAWHRERVVPDWYMAAEYAGIVSLNEVPEHKRPQLLTE